MKKLLTCLGIFLFSFSLAYAGGGMTHMFIAEGTIAKLPNEKLRHLLLDNLDAYLVGSYYPDSGYVKGTHHGTDSHGDAFIYAFTDHIKEKYSDPVIQHPKLVAFLFGCAVHRVSDEIIHFVFYMQAKDKDFNGDYNKAHEYSDTGIDLLLNIDKNQWMTHPNTWWVPVNDLLNVYHRLGKDQYTADQIRWGNTALFLAGYGERIISPFAYPYLRWKAPWTATHYYDWPQGGILMDEDKVAEYLMDLWDRLNNKKSDTTKRAIAQTSLHRVSSETSPAVDFAQNIMQSGAVNIPVKSNDDGSIELQSPVIIEFNKFMTLVNEFKNKLIK
jgi:Zinc dependent phospholipase C